MNENENLPNILAPDIAKKLSNLPPKEQIIHLKKLPIQVAAESIVEMHKHEQEFLFLELSASFFAEIIANMPPDEAVSIVKDLEHEQIKAFFPLLSLEDKEMLSHLLVYKEGSAGGVMNTEIIIFNVNLTVDQAIEEIRQEVNNKELPYYIYVTDDNQKLTGVVSLREIMIAPVGTILKNMLKKQGLITVYFDEEKEEVSKLIKRYSFLAIPVIDYDNHLLGMVTMDDAFEIMQDSASEDMQGMVGAGSDETMDSPYTYSVKKRLPWLVVNIMTSALAAFVVSLFEGNIASMSILAALMPIVANQAGNAGQQALAVMIRQLAIEKFEKKRFLFAVVREMKIGLVNGFFIAAIVFLALLLVSNNIKLAGVVAIAIGVDMFIGAFAGASIPLILRILKRDPAQASSIFLTAITDTVGFFIFLSLASIFLF